MLLLYRVGECYGCIGECYGCIEWENVRVGDCYCCLEWENVIAV